MPGVEGLYHDLAGAGGSEVESSPSQMGRGTRRSLVEGFFSKSEEPLHRASRGPPPREIAGRN
jgi:hypothetical protein